MISSNSFIDLSDRVILVAGASSGIGRQAAILLSDLGARLILSARRQEALLETKSMLSTNNQQDHICLPFDLRKITEISGFMDEVVEKTGKLNGLVYTAGINQLRPYNVSKPEHMQMIMQTNFFAFYELVRCFADKKHCEDGSKIVAISSIASVRPGKGQAAYAASKAAMEAAVMCLAQELIPKRISINVVRPGAVNTNIPTNYNIDKVAIIEKQPLGEIMADDVAGMIAFLLSQYADQITGRGFDVDGGRLSRE